MIPVSLHDYHPPQYESAFSPQRLQNYQVPTKHKEVSQHVTHNLVQEELGSLEGREQKHSVSVAASLQCSSPQKKKKIY